MSELNRPERLAALRRSGLLDKSVVARLDSVAYTAVRLLDAHAAQINALDDQFQRTVVGYPPGHWPEHMAVDITGCKQVILAKAPLVIDDTTEHPDTCGMPWTAGYKAYLGVPIFHDNEVIGSLCVLDDKPRKWTRHDVLGMEGLAQLVMLSLEHDVLA